MARGDEVVCLVRRTSHVEHLRPLGVQFREGDVTDLESMRRAVAGMQTVYHVAGCTMTLQTADFYRINTGGMGHVAQACAEQQQPPVLVIVSSLAAAGPAPRQTPRVESDRPVQVSEYGRSKRLGELAAQRLADSVPITIVRPPIVFGERDRVGLDMFRSVARVGVHLIPGVARHRFSLIHAADLAQLLILAADHGHRLPSSEYPETTVGEGTYFAACEVNPTYMELGRMIGKVLGRRRVLTLHTTTPLVWMIAAAGDLAGHLLGHPMFLNLDKAWEVTAGSWTCSPRAAVEGLGFSVAAPLESRLAQTAQWFRQEKWL